MGAKPVPLSSYWLGFPLAKVPWGQTSDLEGELELQGDISG